MIQGIQEIQPWLSEATERLRLEFDPEKIILFGSWACGDATRRSDIDLFMVWRCEIGPLDRIGKVLDLLSDAPRTVDAIVYTPSELLRCQHRPFIAQLLKEGKILYERSEAALDKLYIPTRYPDALAELTPAEAFTQREAKAAITSAQKIISRVEARIHGITS